MYFLYILSILALVVQAAFVTMSIAAGLYYLAELVEEYTVTAKYVISWLVVITAVIHICLLLFEDLPLHLGALGVLQQCLHALLLRRFPVVRPQSAAFVAAVGTLVLHHYCAFQYFGQVYYNFSETLIAVLKRRFPVVRPQSSAVVAAVGALVLHHYCAFQYPNKTRKEPKRPENTVLAYFTLCLWVVPFALFVSLSANDYVLPTTGERQHLLDDGNVVSDYLSRKAKKYSLLSFFSYAKDSILPQRSKKAF